MVDQLYVIAKPSGHGGFSQWRTPPKGNTGRTRYGLCHRLDTGRVVVEVKRPRAPQLDPIRAASTRTGLALALVGDSGN
jgi:hypothetical protein